MKRVLLISLLILSFSYSAKSQLAVCSGSFVFGAGDCNVGQIGDGTAGFIRICITVNNIASGGGTKCNPGGACDPPFGGGGWDPRIAIFSSNGAGSIAAAEETWIGGTAVSTCFTVSSSSGYAYFYATCSVSGTTITWETINECGDQVCTGTPPPCIGTDCPTCASPCGTAQGFVSAPTVPEVVTGCNTLPFVPIIVSGDVKTYCYSFRATATSVDFNVVITSTCGGGGNVTALSWELFNSTCGGAMQTGTLASLTFSPVVIGNDYTFCYTFTVATPGPPATSCNHTQHCPYFIGAVVLSNNLARFNGELINNETVQLDWLTTLDSDNTYFIIEKSKDGEIFEAIGKIKDDDGSNSNSSYSFEDKNPFKNTSYYRLKLIDY